MIKITIPYTERKEPWVSRTRSGVITDQGETLHRDFEAVEIKVNSYYDENFSNSDECEPVKEFPFVSNFVENKEKNNYTTVMNFDHDVIPKCIFISYGKKSDVWQCCSSYSGSFDYDKPKQLSLMCPSKSEHYKSFDYVEVYAISGSRWGDKSKDYTLQCTIY